MRPCYGRLVLNSDNEEESGAAFRCSRQLVRGRASHRRGARVDVAGRRAGPAAVLVRPRSSVRCGTAPRRRSRRTGRRERVCAGRRRRLVRRDGAGRGKDCLDRDAVGLHGDAPPSRLDRRRARRARPRGRRRRHRGPERDRRPRRAVRVLRRPRHRGCAGLRRPAAAAAAAPGDTHAAAPGRRAGGGAGARRRAGASGSSRRCCSVRAGARRRRERSRGRSRWDRRGTGAFGGNEPCGRLARGALARTSRRARHSAARPTGGPCDPCRSRGVRFGSREKGRAGRTPPTSRAGRARAINGDVGGACTRRAPVGASLCAAPIVAACRSCCVARRCGRRPPGVEAPPKRPRRQTYHGYR